MPQIKKITHLKHPGVLRDFRWPPGLNQFTKYNLIYGPNGSGKTTVSSIFRHLEKSQCPPSDVEVKLDIDDRSIAGKSFSDQSSFPIRVFNREFVSENVFPVTQEKGMPLILVLGKESSEKQKELENLQGQESEIKSKLVDVRDKLERASCNLAQHSTDRARAIKDDLLKYDSQRYRNYDKRNYEKKANQMIQAGEAGNSTLGSSQSRRLYALLGEDPKLNIGLVQIPVSPAAEVLGQVNTILARTVKSSVSEPLKEDAPLANWVGEGFNLYRERDSEVCLFCEQIVPEHRLAELEGHFSDEHGRLVKEIGQFITQLKENQQEIDQVHMPQLSDFYSEFKDEYDLTRAEFLTSCQKWNDFLDELKRKLEEKKTQTSTKSELEVEAPESPESAMTSLNEVIKEHNLAHNKFSVRKTEAIEKLESNLILEKIGEFQDLVAKKKDLRKKVEDHENEINKLTKDIEIVERDIREYRTPAEELNSELHRYLGHNELKLETSDNDTGYRLMRGQSPADNISEGEKTAIALLYFLKTLKHKDYRLEDGIVVLDDPVSSLDSNALYLAFGYIKERTKDAKQLFVLTHNFALFRQVKNWFHHVRRANKKKSNVEYYMLGKISQSNPRKTKLEKLDSLLEKYENEYHYLFAQVYRRINESRKVSMEHDYGLANTARRLLEIFFAFQRPGDPKSFYGKLSSSQFDGAKTNRILRFTNTFSHGNATGVSEHSGSVLLETKPILKDILDLIKFENKEHYKLMVKSINGLH